jgi:carbon-monoxide dehydrogenase medium subunit
MIPKEFSYVAPGSLEEALQALREGGEDAKPLAGGHSLIPAMKIRLAAPTTLVDLRKIGELQGIQAEGNGIRVGAMVTYKKLQESAELSGGCPLLQECAATIGDMQVRARGTIGGSLAHADPAADITAAVLALDGVMLVAGLNGNNGGGGISRREIAAGDFFVDLLSTALESGEILTGVRVPRLQGRTSSAYVKIRNKASHYALVGVAAVLQLGDDGTCTSAAVAITGAASKPFRLTSVEDSLRGSKLEDGDIESALGTIGDVDAEWMSDLFGSEEYRRHLTGVAARNAINTARERISG